ncbi:phosphatidylinositol-specific phospholipase C1-like protein [Novosphingobium sediminicola]|uniref:Calcium-dependent phosphoinositide phospholipase C n=1 Tax=Novosphingobium sediminicola TaxID=563162 RepID=A0A7W6CIU7_9SPHN|nr:phosphatidylinositol-specific phospholipase C1-like protein [Novosphingobium sediminicola]MBB3957284.1 hypothetical protein [Novosphingobium sediminicola]
MRLPASGPLLLPLTMGLAALATPAAAHRDVCRLDAPDVAHAGKGCEERWMDVNLRVNDLLTVGTHNSYKRAIPPADYRLITAYNPRLAQELDYAHKSITAQLDFGAREIEIDVVYDPQGGRYAHPMIAAQTQTALDPAWVRAMQRPGFKVQHVPDVDFRSHCITFKACLGMVRDWSRAHPRHAPVTILINAKDGKTLPGGTPLLSFDEAAFDALDAEVRAVLPPAQLLTPDDVQGRYATLREAVLHNNWPRLGAARGRILFALDEAPEKVALYRGHRSSLEGRVMFINTDEQSPAAAYLTLNRPVEDADRIARDVKAGFLVRTRADEGTWQARTNDIAHRDIALHSGAQSVSTDYLWADPRFAGGFTVSLPDHAASMCNPMRTAQRCGNLPVERVSKADWAKAQTAPIVWPATR